MTLDKLQPGATVYSIRRYRMGNTPLRSTAIYKVKIVSVDPERGSVLASLNGGPPKTFFRRTWSKWRMKEPRLVYNKLSGQVRLAKKGE